MIGITVLREQIDPLSLVGTTIIVAAGLFTMMRERAVKGDEDPAVGDLPPRDPDDFVRPAAGGKKESAKKRWM